MVRLGINPGWAEMADEGISPEEYERWLTPAQSLSLLEALDSRTAVQAIVGKLWDEEIRAAAKTAVLRRGQEIFRSNYPLITAASWGSVPMNPDTTLWKTGTLDLAFGPTSLKPGAPSDYWVFHGVRFDREGVRELLAATASTPPALQTEAAPVVPALKDDRRPLATAERQRFARLYAELFGESGTETRAYQALGACYPDFKVSRDPFLADFRAIRGKQVTGRKGKTEK